MNNGVQKRISGTYWERFLFIALPIPSLVLLFLILKYGLSGSWEVALILIALMVLIWIVDCAPARQRDPVVVLDDEWLFIGEDLVSISAIQSITPLRHYRYGAPLIEIIYKVNGESRTVNVLSKPDLVPRGLLPFTPKTLRVLIRNHPELEQLVQPERVI